MQPRSNSPIQTIRISDKEKEKLVWAINASPQISVGEDPDRLQVRPTHSNALLTIIDQNGSSSDFAVIAYSTGRRGISVVHGRFVHPRQCCTIRFKSLSGEWHERTGLTGQCVHVKGTIHALLVVFDEPINLDEFAMLTPEQETRHLQEIAQEQPHLEDVEFKAHVRSVLFVDDQASDRKLVNHWLNRASMKVTTLGTVAEACAQIAVEHFDLMIVDLCLWEESGVDLIRRVRAEQVGDPILAVSADDRPETQSGAIAAGANGFLAKPFSDQQLVEAAQRLMGLDPATDQSPIYSTLGDDPEMVPLLTGYARSLTSKIEELRDASAKAQLDKLEFFAQSLKGSAVGYGYPDITASATSVLGVLEDDSADIKDVKRTVAELIGVLGRVKVRMPSA